jgi:hypothetical protein
MFTEGKTHYLGFLSLANKLPVVYMPKIKYDVEGSLLMPGIPVSGGTLRTMQQTLGEVDGIPALITDENADNSLPYSAFLLYTAEQSTIRRDCPEVKFKVRAVQPDEFTIVDGCLALVDSDFANEMKGWALVRLRGKNCSSQGIVTRCTYYEQYTTDEALQKYEQAKASGMEEAKLLKLEKKKVSAQQKVLKTREKAEKLAKKL